MTNKYVVSLSDAKRAELRPLIRKGIASVRMINRVRCCSQLAFHTVLKARDYHAQRTQRMEVWNEVSGSSRGVTLVRMKPCCVLDPFSRLAAEPLRSS